MAAAQLAVTPSTAVRTARLSVCSAPAAVSLAMSLPQKPAAGAQAVGAPAAAVEKAAPPPAGGRADVRASPAPALASVWREVQGASDWCGMVRPLHPLLRAEVVRYGELVAACYRALDLDRTSKRYLRCRYGRKRMLPSAGMASAGYAVTKYIYAAADVPALPLPMGVVFANSGGGMSRWIGYVAVSSDGECSRLGRRDILVSFRGTVTAPEWLANFMSALAPARFDPADPRPDVRVESGFLSLYTSDDHADARFAAGSCRNQLLAEVTRLISAYKHENLSITLAGHSMGSSLALLLGYDLAELGFNRGSGGVTGAIPITVFSFAGPRVGNVEFRNRCNELGVKVLRVANVHDPVTKMPGIVFNEGARVWGGRHELPWSKACYAHVGVEVAVDFFNSRDPACVHDLEAYLAHLKDDVSSVASMARREEEYLNGRVASVFESWRWYMAAIRASELLQALGI